MYHQSNKKDVTEELQLAKFDWRIREFTHSLDTGITNVEVIMEKDGAENSRSFEVLKLKDFSDKAIYKELLKLPAFKGSKLN